MLPPPNWPADANASVVQLLQTAAHQQARCKWALCSGRHVFGCAGGRACEGCKLRFVSRRPLPSLTRQPAPRVRARGPHSQHLQLLTLALQASRSAPLRRRHRRRPACHLPLGRHQLRHRPPSRRARHCPTARATRRPTCSLMSSSPASIPRVRRCACTVLHALLPGAGTSCGPPAAVLARRVVDLSFPP